MEIREAAAAVFAYIDDIRNVGGHMTDESSMAMMALRLRLEVVSERRTGLGATYRYFSESVTAYHPPQEKVWQIIGRAR